MYNRQHTGCGPAMRGRHAHYARWAAGTKRPKYNVPMNTLEYDTHFEVHVYAVGFAKESIKLSIADEVLFIRGTREVDENNLPNFIHQEFPIRSFERVVSLRGQVDIVNISARQEDGILIITLPKTPEAKKPVQEIKVM
jgi:HSP20 family protein